MKAISILFKGGGIAKLELNDSESLDKVVECLRKDLTTGRGEFELTNKRLGISIFGLCENISAIIAEDNETPDRQRKRNV